MDTSVVVEDIRRSEGLVVLEDHEKALASCDLSAKSLSLIPKGCLRLQSLIRCHYTKPGKLMVSLFAGWRYAENLFSPCVAETRRENLRPFDPHFNYFVLSVSQGEGICVPIEGDGHSHKAFFFFLVTHFYGIHTLEIR